MLRSCCRKYRRESEGSNVHLLCVVRGTVGRVMESRNPEGAIVLSEIVTDGTDEWLETRRYYGYTPGEARRLFVEHLTSNGYTETEG